MSWKATEWRDGEKRIWYTENDALYHFRSNDFLCHHFTSLESAQRFADEWQENDLRYTGHEAGP